mmetsp:Transcript_29909/g.61493  ORF Transcript_29909/g.61493 Transcript_29909/m.61493 type:complete len:203 (-) Transcript_29909:911-1519(-)
MFQFTSNSSSLTQCENMLAIASAPSAPSAFPPMLSDFKSLHLASALEMCRAPSLLIWFPQRLRVSSFVQVRKDMLKSLAPSSFICTHPKSSSTNVDARDLINRPRFFVLSLLYLFPASFNTLIPTPCTPPPASSVTHPAAAPACDACDTACVACGGGGAAATIAASPPSPAASATAPPSTTFPSSTSQANSSAKLAMPLALR